MQKSKKFHVNFTTVERILDAVCPCKCWGCGGPFGPVCERCFFYNSRINPGFVEGDAVMFVGGVRDGLVARMIVDYKYHSVRALAAPLAKIMAKSIETAVCEEEGTREAVERLRGQIRGDGRRAAGFRTAGMNLDERAGVGFDGELEVVIVPLPTIRKHIRERGFDHILRLGQELARETGWSCEPLLRRVNATVQVGADGETRVRQAREAYQIDDGVLEEIRGVKDWSAAREDAREKAVREGVGGRDDERSTRMIEKGCGSGAEPMILLIDDVTTTGASLDAAEEVVRGAGFTEVYRAVIAKSSIDLDEEEKAALEDEAGELN